MKIFLTFSTLILVVVLGCKVDSPALIAEENSYEISQVVPELVDFNFHVRPILSDKCFKCHGPDKNKIEAGLSFASEKDALKALESDPTKYAIVKGDVAKSDLVHRIRTQDEDLVMPPPAANLDLSDYEKDVLEKWIAQGASWKEHWSFMPLAAEIPEVKEGIMYNNIDRFILKKLEGSDLNQSPKADKTYLIRRLYFDLTGLPPTIEQINSFVSNNDDNAYEQVVDQLLNLDGYAENMTAIWMDVSRYADTHGYQDDLERVMWPWRDWVIHAFKNNMPYDQFVKWQLAGDLFPKATTEQVIATAFNRNHKITQEGGVIPEEYRVEYVSDRTQTFGKAFLGLSVECAKCHDHKYDPISQEDFYSLFAFFNNVPEKGLIEPYGAIPEPYIKLSAKQIEEQLTFINNVDTLDEIPLMVMKEQPRKRKTFILNRGLYDQLGDEVSAKPPMFLNDFSKYDKNRVGLADWLFDKENPLTSRVMINRLWQMVYGQGIVATPDDFGAQGSLPSHPELLDHLAQEFIDSGWDMKKMLKYMVMSYTYQQSSVSDEKALELDPENLLLARAPRIRLTAEKIVDHALASSGLLKPVVGGPSVKPYQPEGLWQETTGGGGGSTSRYVKDKGDKQYRRSLYTFWKRTVPPPNMMTLDAVTRDFCMVKREVTSTPLQALVMMNDPRMLEASRNFAYMAINNENTLESRLEFLFYQATSRPPEVVELEKLREYYQEELSRFESNPTDAEAFLAIGDSPNMSDLPNAETAAYAIVANAILNLDESITRS